MVTSTFCSFKGPSFGSQHPHSSSESPITPVPENKIPIYFLGTRHTCSIPIHICRQTIHTHNIKKESKKEETNLLLVIWYFEKVHITVLHSFYILPLIPWRLHEIELSWCKGWPFPPSVSLHILFATWWSLCTFFDLSLGIRSSEKYSVWFIVFLMSLFQNPGLVCGAFPFMLKGFPSFNP